MPDPEMVARAHRAAAVLEKAWDRWRTAQGIATGPMPPISSYVGYSIEEPWGRPRVVLGVDAREAEHLAALLDSWARACETAGDTPASESPGGHAPGSGTAVRARIPPQAPAPHARAAEGLTVTEQARSHQARPAPGDQTLRGADSRRDVPGGAATETAPAREDAFAAGAGSEAQPGTAGRDGGNEPPGGSGPAAGASGSAEGRMAEGPAATAPSWDTGTQHPAAARGWQQPPARLPGHEGKHASQPRRQRRASRLPAAPPGRGGWPAGGGPGGRAGLGGRSRRGGWSAGGGPGGRAGLGGRSRRGSRGRAWRGASAPGGGRKRGGRRAPGENPARWRGLAWREDMAWGERPARGGRTAGRDRADARARGERRGSRSRRHGWPRGGAG
jgi:hypothetical protein